jgi:hypothetical protein
MFLICTGGALSHARGALSSWWNTLTNVQSPEGEVSGLVPLADEAEPHENEETSNHNIRDSSLEKHESGKLILTLWPLTFLQDKFPYDVSPLFSFLTHLVLCYIAGVCHLNLNSDSYLHILVLFFP